MSEQELTAREIEQRRKAPLKHGGEAAVKAIQQGEPLSGLAAEAERSIYADLANDGAHELVVRNAVRLQAAADLYWQAVLGAQDLEKLDIYVKRYGWLAGSALRAWAQVQDTDRRGDRITPDQVLEAINGKNK
jgi:hypothetical protein